ncbi:hypothetical protein HUG15_04340 [Salicibibacter cibarius]|uniref:Uncharacterized protein n=1 Tax=Salicibibacter cibarius TaxID=2743000 RepID=A0A7T6Z1F6_9BACI|nr:hypothetical protein [Salicibibacter cibarius]QQK74907.1 hypothetical protein HUG15_04340 [Salicibibacter cibarius]
MDPLTLIIIIIMVIFFFPVIMRGIGCLLRTISIVILIVGALILLGIFL